MDLLFPGRIKRLQQRLRNRKIDALLVSEPANRRYLSGYRAEDHSIQESSGLLLVPAQGAPLLLTDSRFALQAKEESPGFDLHLYPRGLLACLEGLLPDLGIRNLAFESQYTLHATALRLQALADKHTIHLFAASDLVERQRLIKDEEELEKLRAAVRLGEKVFQKVLPSIQPGRSEEEVADTLELTMREMGAQGPSFPTIVAFGDNAARPHAVPGPRLLQPGEIVLIDMGLILNGYCSDMTRTILCGQADPLFLERRAIVRKAQLAAIRTIRAGVTCREVDQAARRVIASAGYGSSFGHALGHGVGLAVHEGPRISSRSRKRLQSGMVVTVEPGLYIAGWGGIRLENMVAVTRDGCEVLNQDTTGLD